VVRKGLEKRQQMEVRCKVLLVLLSIIISSCEDISKSSLVCDTKEIEFSYSGGEKKILIESDADWSIYEVPEWLVVSEYSGVKNKEVLFTAIPNETGIDREKEITIRANDNKSICSIKIKQFAYAEGRILQVDNTFEKYFNGNTSYEYEDSIVIKSSIPWTIKGPSWLGARFEGTPTPMNGEVREGSGVLSLRGSEQNLSYESLTDTICISSELGDIVYKIPVIQLGAEDIKCVNIVTLTSGFAFKVKAGCQVLSFKYKVFDGLLSEEDIAGEDTDSWQDTDLLLYDFNISKANCNPNNNYTVFMRGLTLNKYNVHTFHTPSETNQPRAEIKNFVSGPSSYSFDIVMNQYAKGYYCVSLNDNWYNKSEIDIAYNLYQNIKNGKLKYYTQDKALSIKAETGIIVTWAISEDGNFSGVLDIHKF